MKTIILAAGYGNRMRPLTDQTHKTLLKIGQKTILQRIIDSLIELNLTDITIVTGYRDEDIKVHLSQNYKDFIFSYIHNSRYRETNNIYSMALALQEMSIDSDVILIESDLVFDSKILARLINCDSKNIALVDRYKSGMDGTVVEVNSESKVISNVIPPHLQGVNFDFSDKYKTLNIYRFSQDFCKNIFKRLLTYYAQVIDSNCYYELILGILIYMQKEEIFAEILEGENWAEVDDPNDLSIAKFHFDKSIQQEILNDSYGGYWNYNILDYCFIRNMHFPTDAVLSELKNNFIPLIHNYGSTQSLLNQKIATYLLCRPQNVTLLNGAAQVYPILEQYFSNKKVLLPQPSFGEYNRIFSHKITYSDQVGLDQNEVVEKMKGVDAIVFVNPNNPTGSLLPTEWIYNLAMMNPEVSVIVDESFIDFSSEKSILDLLEAKSIPNVILITSLSKTLGVPGMRLGYVYSANENFNSYVRNKIPIWNINSVAEYFLEIVLKHRKAIEDSFSKTITDREQLSSKLQNLPFVDKVYPSGGNFLLVSLQYDSAYRHTLIHRLLAEYGIYIKDVTDRFGGSKSFLRIAVRDIVDNQKLIQSFQKVAAEIEIQ